MNIQLINIVKIEYIWFASAWDTDSQKFLKF